MSEGAHTTDAPITTATGRFVVIMPAYQEVRHIAEGVRALRGADAVVVVVDDGSTDGTAEAAEAAGAVVLRHAENRGKGVALSTGFAWARERGANAVVTMDADGQHDPAEVPRFLETYQRTGIPVLVGNRMWHPRGMPPIRRWTNRFMSRVLSRKMGQYVPDTQCGFRLYRCDLLPFVEAHYAGFAAESEILLHVAACGIRIGSVRIATIYRGEKSSISPLRDTFRFFRMLLAHHAQRARRPWRSS